MRTLRVQAALAGLAMVLAFMSWRTDGGAEPLTKRGALLLRCPDGLDRAQLEMGDKKVQLAWKDVDGARRAWLTVQQGDAPEEAFATNTRGEKYLRERDQLFALQDLGKVSPEKLEELGLRTPAGELVLRCGQQSLSLALGATTFGTSRYYARRTDGGPVHQVGRAVVADLERGLDLFKPAEGAPE